MVIFIIFDVSGVLVKADNPGQIDKGLQEEILKLKAKGYKIGIISNVSERYFNALQGGEVSNYDCVIFGRDENIMKPDRLIFDKWLKKAKATAEDCLFIDDMPENLESAQRIGMKTIQFTNNQQVIEDIQKMLDAKKHPSN